MRVLRDTLRRYGLERFLAGAGRLFAIKLLGMAGNFGLQVLLARILGPVAFGHYTLGMSWALLLAVPGALGLPTAAIRLGAQYLVRESYEPLRGLLWWAPGISVLVSASLALVAAYASLHYDLAPHDGMSALLLGLAATPLVALLRTNAGLIRAFDMPLLALTPDMLLRPLGLVAVALAWSHFTSLPTAEGFMALTIGVLVALVVGQFVAFLARAGSTVRGAVSFEARTWLGVCLPLALVAGFEVIIERVDVLMVGALRSAEEVSLYHAAARVSGLLFIVLSTINAVIAPRIVRMHAEQRLEELQRLVAMLVRLSFTATVVMAVALMLGGELVLGLFGSSFVDALTALRIMCLAHVLNTAAGPVLMLMNMTGLQSDSARIFAVSATVNVLLNWLLIPPYGIQGAALASAVSIALWNVWMALVVKRKLGISSHVLYRPGH